MNLKKIVIKYWVMSKMCQHNILNYLKGYKGYWFTKTQLSVAIGVEPSSVSKNLKKLRKQKWVKFRYLKGKYFYSALD
jgi:Mn-dependent DtxR family transcriptional regulator